MLFSVVDQTLDFGNCCCYSNFYLVALIIIMQNYSVHTHVIDCKRYSCNKDKNYYLSSNFCAFLRGQITDILTLVEIFFFNDRTDHQEPPKSTALSVFVNNFVEYKVCMTC